MIFLAPTWVPETPVANGRLALTMMGVVANNEIEADINFQRIPVDISRTDDTLGVGDLYPHASISWNSGVNNYKLYATGDIPVGDYDPKRLANIGIGHGAIDGGGAYTYFNPETGHELSGTLGFTYNFENTESQDYKNGIDMHLDWGVSQWISKTTMFGVAGYLYYQLTDYTYRPIQLGRAPRAFPWRFSVEGRVCRAAICPYLRGRRRSGLYDGPRLLGILGGAPNARGKRVSPGRHPARRTKEK